MFNPFISYLRWRHAKGFGVHSPFAYKFITDVLNPGEYGFYAYHRIDNLLKGKDKFNYKLQNLIKFFIRLSIFLGSERIIATDSCKYAEIAAKSLTIDFIKIKKNKNLTFRPRDLVVIDDSFSDISFVNQFLEQITEAGKSFTNIAIYAIKPQKEIRELLSSTISTGVLFDSRHSLLLIHRPQMAYISYLI